MAVAACEAGCTSSPPIPHPQAEYLLHRAEYTTELEDVFGSTPFEHFPLWRGQGDARHCVGQLKVLENLPLPAAALLDWAPTLPSQGIVRVVDRADAEPLIDVEALLSPRSYVVRVYVLTGAPRQLQALLRGTLTPPPSASAASAGHDLTPHDDDGRNDPYLVFRLGDTVISRRAAFKPHTNDPEFFEAVELRTTLPGPATLTVECWDHDCESGEG